MRLRDPEPILRNFNMHNGSSVRTSKPRVTHRQSDKLPVTYLPEQN